MTCKVSVLEALDLLGLARPETVPGHISSPNRSDSEPSLWIEGDRHWFDFGDGVGGDAIDLVRYVTGASYVKAVQYLSSAIDMDERPEPVAQVVPAKIDFTDELMQERSNIESLQYCGDDVNHTPQFDAWFKNKWPHLPLERMLKDEVVCHGYGRLLIPHWNADHRAYGVKYRTLDGGKKAYKGSTFTDRLYRCEEKTKDHLYAYVTEGESDCWTAHYDLARPHWWHVLALPSGASVVRDAFIEELNDQYDVVRLHFDSDAAGQAATKKVLPFLHHGVDVSTRLDLTDSWLDGWRPKW